MSGQYAISKHENGWVISVDGAMLLICERRSAAISAVLDATSPGEIGRGAVGLPCRQQMEDEVAEEPHGAAAVVR